MKRLVQFLLAYRKDCVVMGTDNSKAVVDIWTDSDWAGERTRKSYDCVVVEMYGVIVSFSVRQQSFIAQSSAEAELTGIHRGVLQGLFLLSFWAEAVDQHLSCCIHSDSKAGLAIAARRGVGRVKHLEVRQLFVQQVICTGRISLQKCAGHENVADFGTRPLDAHALYKRTRETPDYLAS